MSDLSRRINAGAAVLVLLGSLGVMLCRYTSYSSPSEHSAPNELSPTRVETTHSSHSGTHSELAELAGPYAQLPPFVDGGMRCGLSKVAKSRPNEPNPSGIPPPQETPQRAAQWDALHAGNSESETICSGPRAWCVLFGPSESDKQNERIRTRMKMVSEERARQAAQLRQKLNEAEASSAAERRRHASELRRLSETLAGQGIYLTNDESMSLASPQRLIWAIDHHAPLPASQVRPHELLNYFTFDTTPVRSGEAFSVLPEIAQHPARPDEVTLAFSVRGRENTRETRDNANLAYVVDRSASMNEPGHLNYAKRGLLRSLEELKAGDIVHLVVFDSTTCELARNFVVGRDSIARLRDLMTNIEPREGSNLPDGLSRGYAAVNRVYQPEYSNRVILMTDSRAVPEREIREAMTLSSRNFDARRVRLSALGLGANVDDELLDQLTERGRGASIFLSSPEETDAVFGERFVALIENAASDVHFRLQLPASLKLRAFYGEEASPSRGRVQSVHYASGTTQMYLANLINPQGHIAQDDRISLRIEYEDPKSGKAESTDFSWSAMELGITSEGKAPIRAGFNLTKARMVATFGYHLRAMAERYARLSSVWQASAQAWQLTDSNGQRDSNESLAKLNARQSCLTTQGQLDAFAAELQGEPEARRIASLWSRYCERYPGPSGEIIAQPTPRKTPRALAHGRAPAPPSSLSEDSPARFPMHSSVLPINDFLPGETEFDTPVATN